MSSPQPEAKGTLGATPLVQLLVYALERRLTGAFIFQSGEDKRSTLTMAEGVPCKTRLADSEQHRLGDVAVRLGLVQRAKVEEAAENSKAGRLIGQRLVQNQALTAEDLQRALRKQLLSHVRWLSNLPGETLYAYYAGHDFLTSRPPAEEVDPLAAIWGAVRPGRLRKAAEYVAKLENVTLRLHAQARVGRFGFTASEQAVVDVLRAKPQTWKELRHSGLLPVAKLEAILFALALTRHLDLQSGEFPLDVDASSLAAPLAPAPTRRALSTHRGKDPPQTDPGPSAPNSALLSEMDRLIEGSASFDYYHLLGVQPEASTGTIQAAFLQLAKRWHPDKLRDHAPERREEMVRVFARMTEAHQVLTNPQQRLEYDRLMEESDGDEQETVQAVLRAANNFQKAEVLARKGDWEHAVELAEKAYLDDPEQPEYSALHAWVIAKSGRRGKTGEFDDLLERLTVASKASPRNMRIHQYRAEVLQLAGELSEAMKAYRIIVEVEPSNVDAQRQLRLYRMRRSDSASARKTARPAGLFGKLFNKD